MSHSSINVVALSTDNNSAINLLKSCFPGLKYNTDTFNDFATYDVEGTTVRLYTKYPNYEITKSFPQYLDLLLISVPHGDEKESEILDYADSKWDCREIYLIDEGEARKISNEIKQTKAEAVLKFINLFRNDLNEFMTKYSDSDDETLRTRRRMVSAKDHYMDVKLVNVIEGKVLPILSQMRNSFQGFDLNRGYSENSLSFDLSPCKESSIGQNGIGLALNIFFGDAFDENNLHLPLVVRENLFTGAIELKAKSPEKADELITTLKNVYKLFEENGLTLLLKTYFHTEVSFSKDGSSIFIDFVFGNVFGESLINNFKDIKFFDFSYSFHDKLRIFTGLNVSDLWENPDLNNITDKLLNLTVDGKGNFINFRTIFYLLREFHKVKGTSKGDKKLGIFGSSALLILSCFEKANFELKYDPKDLKGNLMEIGDDLLQGEGSANAFIGLLNEQFNGTYLPMAMELLKSFIPLINSFGDISVVNFDEISIEALIPALKLELKLDLLLPGLTKFVEKNVKN